MKKMGKKAVFVGLVSYFVGMHAAEEPIFENLKNNLRNGMKTLHIDQIEQGVKVLKTQGYGIDFTNTPGFTLLAAAVKANRADAVEFLLTEGSSPEVYHNIHSSVVDHVQDPAIINLLIKHKILGEWFFKFHPAAKNALTQAVMEGRLGKVVALVKAGVDIEFKDEAGKKVWQKAHDINVIVYLKMQHKKRSRLKICDQYFESLIQQILLRRTVQ